MRRIAAVLVLLLTATAVQAGVEEGGGNLDSIVYGIACCGSLPFVLVFSVVIALAIYDWRKAARRRELMNRSAGDN